MLDQFQNQIKAASRIPGGNQIVNGTNDFDPSLNLLQGMQK